ncbi:hypothetical protein MKJ01_05590 [Chryseobacterium sp. SSA4.19]|uniref:hypothetical protein n=1 Tax=Chryseobacterium sp. SSA4.19 TaxID=2919915 RepID=UPI001F4EBBDF|nr:hypothetical protein [Chryseobacterium sp. SSA4.19]MCJ8153233.1 hypothetical protein [Chryseobacterium sp. SSA4.19]
MEQLEQIKENLAKEKGFEDYSEMLLQSTHSFGDLDDVINELCARYAKLCINVSLEKAAENATAVYDSNFIADVKKDSILNPTNIILL